MTIDYILYLYFICSVEFVTLGYVHFHAVTEYTDHTTISSQYF